MINLFPVKNKCHGVIPEQPECAKTTGSGDAESVERFFTGRVGSFPLNGNACVLTQARPAQVSRGRREITETKNTGETVIRPPERMLQLFFGSFMFPNIWFPVFHYDSRRGGKVKSGYCLFGEFLTELVCF